MRRRARRRAAHLQHSTAEGGQGVHIRHHAAEASRFGDASRRFGAARFRLQEAHVHGGRWGARSWYGGLRGEERTVVATAVLHALDPGTAH
jgi:hypothetical protein